jgi:hypothetical protein
VKLAVSQLKRFTHALGDGEVVGDDDEGDAVVAVEGEEEDGDGVGGGGIEGAGGFIGEDELGAIDEGAGDGGAEFFAAGELPRESGLLGRRMQLLGCMGDTSTD